MAIQTFDPKNEAHIEDMIESWENGYHAVQAQDPTDSCHPDYCETQVDALMEVL